jgi:3D (Asp-Asp-Asp) domain-containing protein
MMNENRNLISMRQRRMIRQLNREIQARKERRSVARKVFAVIMTVCLIIIGALVMVCAAEIRAAEDAQAAVLRDFRIRPETLAQYPHSPNVGLQAEDPYMVESVPAEAPVDGEPPEAIEIVTKEATAAEAVPAERWESLGVWKLTAYCPCEKCNGRGRAWKTASGAPMVVGRTVAVGGLPFGTELMINGQTYVVEDRGVHGRHVDILHESHAAANRFGIQRAEVFIKR